MKKLIHPVAGTVALLTITSFWVSTILSELFGTEQSVVAVKTAIPWGLLLLVPALAATAGTGASLAGDRRAGLIGAKLRRMRIVAANGLLVLVPSALLLAAKARAGAFDATFHGVQGVELIAGAANILLLGLNMRAGLKMTARPGRRRHSPAR